MSRVIALCFLLLAAVLGYIHIDSRPAWAPFLIQELISPEADDADKLQPENKPSTKLKPPPQAAILNPQLNWLP